MKTSTNAVASTNDFSHINLKLVYGSDFFNLPGLAFKSSRAKGNYQKTVNIGQNAC
mgnify:CR=1 FL=1